MANPGDKKTTELSENTSPNNNDKFYHASAGGVSKFMRLSTLVNFIISLLPPSTGGDSVRVYLGRIAPADIPNTGSVGEYFINSDTKTYWQWTPDDSEDPEGPGSFQDTGDPVQDVEADTAPTLGSVNYVLSDGIYQALLNKANLNHSHSTSEAWLSDIINLLVSKTGFIDQLSEKVEQGTGISLSIVGGKLRISASGTGAEAGDFVSIGGLPLDNLALAAEFAKYQKKPGGWTTVTPSSGTLTLVRNADKGQDQRFRYTESGDITIVLSGTYVEGDIIWLETIMGSDSHTITLPSGFRVKGVTKSTVPYTEREAGETIETWFVNKGSYWEVYEEKAPGEGGAINLPIAISDVTGLQPALDDLQEQIEAIEPTTGIWKDQGSYDPTAGTYPVAANTNPVVSEVKKGFIWTISAIGTLGGSDVNIGDTVRALVDSPGQTASNWAIAENNIGYVPSNIANKSSDVEADKESLIKYPAVKAIVDWIIERYQPILESATNIKTINGDSILGAGNLEVGGENTRNSLDDAATVVWDFTEHNFASLTIAGNRTLDLQNTNDGDCGILYLRQDATGGRTITLPGVTPTGFSISTGAGELTVLGFTNEGGNIIWDYTKYGVVGTADEIPEPPTLFADDTANTLYVTHTLGDGEIEQNENGAGWVAYSGLKNIGNINLASNYWKFRVKAATGRANSSEVGNPAFNYEAPLSVIDSQTWASRVEPDTGATLRVVGSDSFITTLEDQANVDLAQITESAQPKLVTGINGLPCVEVNQGKILTSGNWGAAISSPITRIAVLEFKTLLSSARYALSTISSSARKDFGHFGGNKIMYAGTVLTGNAVAIDTPYIVWLEFNGDGSTDKMYINGNLIATGNAGTQLQINGVQLGYGSSAGAHAWIGDSFVYAGIFSAGVRNDIVNELKAKYGIA